MKTFDFGATIVVYNFIVGVLLALASQRLGEVAAWLAPSGGAAVARLTRISAMTFGCSVAVLSASVYVLFHILRIGL